MATALNEDSIEKKLKTVNNTQDSIQSLSLWIIHHKTHHERIVELWLKALKKTVQPSHRLTLFYLCNDVVQTCKKKKAFIYNSSFKVHLPVAASLVRDNSIKGKVERIFNIWGERNVYDVTFVNELHGVLGGKSANSVRVDSVPEEINVNDPISPVATPIYEEREETEPEPEPVSNENAEEESARILAEFKPHEMIDQIAAFKRQETDMKFRLSQLNHLKLDISSIEAIKRLKDRAHGNDFSSQFEDSSSKLEDLVKRQTQHLEDQKQLLETLSTSETFYEEQYKEAKIVANAYKNFGAHINNMKKKLDELKRTFPDPDSPIPSPDVNAPSPGNTPPHLGSHGGGPHNFTNTTAADSTFKNSGISNAWMYNNSGLAGGTVHEQVGDVYDESPPLEAPSPEDSPQDLNLGGSEQASGSLESRLASFLVDGGGNIGTSGQSNYAPHLASGSKPSKQGLDDGGGTPLDDEAPTTPVQDEPPSPPKRNTPPKKENPIDFLSRLIFQTPKGPPKSGTPSFLDSMLTSSSTSIKKSAESTSPQSQTSPRPWDTWNSKATTSNVTIQPSSPTSFAPTHSGPSSPLQYNPSTPTMVPPPIPMPIPPPPLAMNLNMPPPPPPPFPLSSSIPPNFSTPPPGFHQTSPGQKENWPDANPSVVGSDLNSSRPLHNSVLKELVPSKGTEDKSTDGPAPKETVTPLIDSDAMEMVSEEEDEESMGIIPDTSGDAKAKAEFAEKLKQKTLGIKSSVHVANPNLKTLTGCEDQEDIDMMDRNSPIEDKLPWLSSSTKPQKSSAKSRSRSRSRSRERASRKHKKKKKSKRGHSDVEEDYRDNGEEDGGKVGSVVKKISSRSGSRGSRDSKGDRLDGERKYDKYDDRGGGYGGRGDHKSSHKSSRSGSRDTKDHVEAYTQAYRDAFFQQINQSRFNPFPGGGPPDQRRYKY